MALGNGTLDYVDFDQQEVRVVLLGRTNFQARSYLKLIISQSETFNFQSAAQSIFAQYLFFFVSSLYYYVIL